MPRPRQNLIVIFLAWFVLYCSFALLSPALLDDAVSVHAEVAREMLLRHDPVTLYANGIRYLEKAPVLYWSMAASMRVFGVGAAPARFPLALFVLALLLLTESFARRAFSSARAGLYGALILLTSFGIFIFTRILIPDGIVCLWLVAAVFCFWRTEHGLQERNGDAPILACLGFAAACALNILTKGLIGLVFPVGTVVIYLLLTRGLRQTIRRLRKLHPWAALSTFLLIAAPWHIAAGRANPDEGHPIGLTHAGGHWHVPEPTLGNVHGWTWFYFVNEHLLRYLNLRVPRDYDTVPLFLFWGLLLVWLLPWSAFLFKALAAAPWLAVARTFRLRWLGRFHPFATGTEMWQPRSPDDFTPREKTLLLLTIAALLPVAFFSFSTRQEYYVLPALPFFAILIAGWLEAEATQAESMVVPDPLSRAGQRISVALLACGSVAALACGVLILHTKAPPPNLDLASMLKQNPGEYALSFGHFLDLNAQAMGAFRLPLAITGVSFFLGTLAAWWARREFRPNMSNLFLFGMTYVFLMAAHIGLTTFSPVLSSAQLAAVIRPLLHPTNLIVINDEYEQGSTLGFYLGRSDIHILHGHSANLWYGSFFADAPPIFESEESLAKKWTGVERIFLWTEPEKLPKLPGKVFVIADNGGKEIVSNKASAYWRASGCYMPSSRDAPVPERP